MNCFKKHATRQLANAHRKNSSKWTIVYDLDGTLLDTLEDIRLAANASLRDVASTARDYQAAEVRSMIGDGARVLMQRMLVKHAGDTTEVGKLPDSELVDSAYKSFLKK